MRAVEGGMLGFLLGVVGITLAGAVLGGIHLWTPCGPTPTVAGGVFVGAMMFATEYALTAGVLGTVLGVILGFRRAGQTTCPGSSR